MKPTVSIIIPTTCEGGREPLVRRSIASVLNQDVEIDLIVVVNGDRFDPSLLSKLQQNPALKVRQLAQGNVSAARFHGLSNARGQFFGFLDDDDEFLPRALAQRVALFSDDVDVVVTNGYHYDVAETRLVPASITADANTDPAGSFFRCNWFASPASLFRSTTVEKSLFDITIKHFEWTYLFFSLLSQRKTIRYHDCITYRVYEDTPLSVSKSIDYALAYPDFLLTLMRLHRDPRHRNLLRHKYVGALNGVSKLELSRGRRTAAWTAHIKCLASGGWGYLPYTRHLLR